MLKHQQFRDNESDEMEPRVLKRQHVVMHENKEGQGLDKYKSENKRKDVGYVPLFFIAPPPSP